MQIPVSIMSGKRRFRDLSIDVTCEGVPYKRFFAETVASNELVVAEGDKLYLPANKSYTVNVSYYDGIETRTYSTSVSGVTPTYNVNLDFTATQSSFKINSATVNISADVLSEWPLVADGNVLIRCVGADNYDFTTSHSSSLSSPVFISEKQLSTRIDAIAEWYELETLLRFDGVSPALINYSSTNSNKVQAGTHTVSPQFKANSTKLAKANAIEGASMYIIKNISNGKYYKVNDSGDFVTGDQVDFANVPGSYVLVFEANNSSMTIESGYYTKSSVGTFMSAMLGKYLNAASEGQAPKFSSNTPTQNIIFASGWNSSDSGGGELDLCWGHKQLLGLKDSNIKWGSNSYLTNQSWKWNVYKVSFVDP